MPRPHIDVDGVQDGEEGKAPGDAVNDDLLAAVEELVNHGSEKEKVDEGPRTSQLAKQETATKTAYQMRNAHGAGVT